MIKLASLVVGTLSAGIPALVVTAQLFVSQDYGTLSVGDPVFTQFGWHQGEIVEIDGDTIHVRAHNGKVYMSPRHEVTER